MCFIYLFIYLICIKGSYSCLLFTTRVEVNMFYVRCGIAYSVNALFCIRCGIKLHGTNAAFQPMKISYDTDNKEVIMHYFNWGFKYQSIVHFLKKFHDIVMSVRRRLKEL